MAEALLTKANGKPVDMLGALFLARQSSRFLDLRRAVFLYFSEFGEEDSMAWTTPVLVEICIGLEINGYLPADGYVPPEF
jgi:coenzyme PQQ precursor peptide PqqA